MNKKKTPSLSARVAHELRRRILLGEIQPNEVLIEPALAEEFAASKTPVREALLHLAAEGLVEVLPKKGYLVRPMTSQDLSEVLTMRMLLEPFAAAEAARLATPAQIEELKNRLARQLAAEEADSLDATTFARQFHEYIAELSCNSRVTASLDHCFAEMVRAHHVLPDMRALIQQPEEAAEHQAILDAIIAGNPAAAERAMKDHLATIHRTSIAAQAAGSHLWS